MDAVQRFLDALKALARMYKVKIHPKDIHHLGKTFDDGGQFDCIIGHNGVVVFRK